MSVSRIHPVSTGSGEYAAAWVDDERFLWNDERLDRAAPLIADWTPPKLQLARPRDGATDVLFNPNALAVSERVRAALAGFPELELLPIQVDGVGFYFLLHGVVAADAPPGCSLRRAPPPSGNIVEVFAFPRTFEPVSAFFRLQQPPDSAAGRAGFCFPALYASPRGVAAIAQTCPDYLAATELIVP